MKVIKIETSLALYDSYSHFLPEELELFAAAKLAYQNAYAPYSDFQVGAALLLANGAIYTGSNQENAAFPSGLCAERVALFYAGSAHPGVPIKAIAVTINYDKTTHTDIVSPCGACRQSIAEYAKRYDEPIKMYLLGKNEEVCVVNSIADLLPLVFNGDSLFKQK